MLAAALVAPGKVADFIRSFCLHQSQSTVTIGHCRWKSEGVRDTTNFKEA